VIIVNKHILLASALLLTVLLALPASAARKKKKADAGEPIPSEPVATNTPAESVEAETMAVEKAAETETHPVVVEEPAPAPESVEEAAPTVTEELLEPVPAAPAVKPPEQPKPSGPPPELPMYGRQGQEEAVVRALFALPINSDEWQRATGIEGQWRSWLSDRFGVALAGSYSAWSMSSGTLDLSNYNLEAPEISGSATLLAFGGSALFHPSEDNPYGLTLEAGLRYVMVDSDVVVHFRYYNRGNVDVPGAVPFDDRIVGVLGVEWQKELKPQLSAFLAGGLWYDFFAGDENWLFEELANDFTAAWVQAGLGWTF